MRRCPNIHTHTYCISKGVSLNHMIWEAVVWWLCNFDDLMTCDKENAAWPCLDNHYQHWPTTCFCTNIISLFILWKLLTWSIVTFILYTWIYSYILEGLYCLDQVWYIRLGVQLCRAVDLHIQDFTCRVNDILSLSYLNSPPEGGGEPVFIFWLVVLIYLVQCKNMDSVGSMWNFDKIIKNKMHYIKLDINKYYNWLNCIVFVFIAFHCLQSYLCSWKVILDWCESL